MNEIAEAVQTQLVPSRPLDAIEQTEKLQRMGLDFLSSIHWVVVVIVALLFAAVVVFIKRKHSNEDDSQLIEADQFIQQGTDHIKNIYLNPNGTINANLFKTPIVQDKPDQPEQYATDSINEKLNDKNSGKLLPQIRRFVKNGQLFSFLNSAVNAKEIIEKKTLNLTQRGAIDENQKLASSLRSKFGGDNLRNPLIDSQIKEELEYRKHQQNFATKECAENLADLNDTQLDVLENAFQS